MELFVVTKQSKSDNYTGTCTSYINIVFNGNLSAFQDVTYKVGTLMVS